ncbi:hypothetical protein [Pandoravirus japonicus]|uniref:Uncharacterized protein n=1 Tax=Pandoravirus japonicus TaxID=2823154 RepID=A0A811BRC5_9VIRU|nr:hypothetical protein [Pandoravirus japonicus]
MERPQPPRPHTIERSNPSGPDGAVGRSRRRDNAVLCQPEKRQSAVAVRAESPSCTVDGGAHPHVPPSDCIVTCLADVDPSVAWQILGRLRPSDVTNLARASPRVPRIVADVFDHLSPDLERGRARDDQARPMHEVRSFLGGAVSLSPAPAPAPVPSIRVARAWLAMITMAACHRPQQPLASCFDPPEATVGDVGPHRDKYTRAAVHAARIGCVDTLVDCMQWSLDADPVSDACLPAAKLHNMACVHDSLALFCAAAAIVGDSARRGRLLSPFPALEYADPCTQMCMLCDAVEACTRTLVASATDGNNGDPPLSTRHGPVNYTTRLLVDWLDTRAAERDHLTERGAQAIHKTCRILIDAAISLHNLASSPSPSSSSSGPDDSKCALASLKSIVRAFPRLSGFGRRTIDLIAHAVRSTKDVDGEITASLLSALAGRARDYDDKDLDMPVPDGLPMPCTAVAVPQGRAPASVDDYARTGSDNFLQQLFDHESALLYDAVLPRLEGRDLLALARCSRGLLDIASGWCAANADRRRRQRTSTTGTEHTLDIQRHAAGDMVSNDTADAVAGAFQTVALHGVALPWIEGVVARVQECVRTFDRPRPKTESSDINATMDILWDDASGLLRTLVVATSKAVIGGDRHALAHCLAASDHLEAARRQCVDRRGGLVDLVARMSDIARQYMHAGEPAKLRAFSGRARLLAWMHKNAIPPRSDRRAHAWMVSRDSNVWMPCASLAYMAGRARSPALLDFAVDLAAAGQYTGSLPLTLLVPSRGPAVRFDGGLDAWRGPQRYLCAAAAALGANRGTRGSALSAHTADIGAFVQHLCARLPPSAGPSAVYCERDLVGAILAATRDHNGSTAATRLRATGAQILRS